MNAVVDKMFAEARFCDSPIESRLPSKERLILDLLTVRATIPDHSGESAVRWARDAISKLSLRHAVWLTTPFGDVEVISHNLDALNWIKDEWGKASQDANIVAE
jgi:hypothetical protein